MYRRVIVSLGLIAVLLGVGIVARAWLVATKPAPPRHATELPPLIVDTVKLESRTVTERLVGYGTALADRSAWITAQVAGEIVAISESLRSGARVSADEVLLRIDAREYEHDRDKARAQLAADEAQLARIVIEEQNTQRLLAIATTELEIAEREYQRVLELFEAQQTARREVDIARQAYEATRRATQTLENTLAVLPQQKAAVEAGRDEHRADLSLAELQLERCVLRAPFDGRVDAVAVDYGERVAPGQRLFAVLDPDLIELPVELPVSAANRVEVGANCTLALDSDPARGWRGRIARIAPSADAMNRTFAAFVEVDNRQQAWPLLPGTFVRAVIDGAVLESVLLVPRGCVLNERVFICEDGIARRMAVRVEQQLFDESVIQGVRPGQIVITSNLDALFDGRRVQAREALSGAAGSAEMAADGPEPPADSATAVAVDPAEGT